MPEGEDFVLSILVGGTPIPEYTSRDGDHFVECNLTTLVSYRQSSADNVGDEEEAQVCKGMVI